MTGSAMLQTTILVAVLGTAAGAAVPLVFRAVEQHEERLLEERLDLLEADLLGLYRADGTFPKSAQFDAGEDPRGETIRYRLKKKVAILEPRGFPGVERRISSEIVDTRWSDRAVRELEIVGEAALRYETDTQKLPKRVTALVTRYVGSDYRFDPWGREYRIARANRAVTSDGPDGKRGTADDLVHAMD